VLEFLDAGDDETDLAGGKLGARQRFGREHADVFHQIVGARRHQPNLVLLLQHAIDDANQHDDADVVVEPGINDQRLQRRVFIAARRRNVLHHGFQHVDDAQPALGGAMHGVIGRNADDFLDLVDHALRVGGGQIDLVQHREDFNAELDSRVAVGHGLRFHTLRGIDHQQRAFAGRQRTRNFVGEIDVAGGVNQVELVFLAVLRLVQQGGGLRLDGDAALALQVHRVEYLRLHLAVGKAAAVMNQSVRQRGFAVVDMGDDGEIADQGVAHEESLGAPDGALCL
jgi:hypothetical protein